MTRRIDGYTDTDEVFRVTIRTPSRVRVEVPCRAMIRSILGFLEDVFPREPEQFLPSSPTRQPCRVSILRGMGPSHETGEEGTFSCAARNFAPESHVLPDFCSPGSPLLSPPLARPPRRPVSDRGHPTQALQSRSGVRSARLAIGCLPVPSTAPTTVAGHENVWNSVRGILSSGPCVPWRKG